LLFGAGRLEAFPVDVWILKTLARRYGLDDWRTPHLAQFGRVHFGPLAGLAQQFLFAWERAQKKTAA
jgi:N-glycosylase/DNA lyase